jgi:hypothetical protein
MKQEASCSGKIKIYTDHEHHIELGTLKHDGIELKGIDLNDELSQLNEIIQQKKIVNLLQEVNFQILQYLLRKIYYLKIKTNKIKNCK